MVAVNSRRLMGELHKADSMRIVTNARRIKRLTRRHRELMAYMLAHAAHTLIQIAAATGYTSRHLSYFVNAPCFRHLYSHLSWEEFKRAVQLFHARATCKYRAATVTEYPRSWSLSRKASTTGSFGLAPTSRKPTTGMTVDSCAQVAMGEAGRVSPVTAAKDSASPDHLIGAQQNRLGDRDAESFGRLEIEDQLELGRLLDR